MDNFTPINLTPDFEAKVQQFTKFKSNRDFIGFLITYKKWIPLEE